MAVHAIVLGDTHLGYACQKSLKKAYELIQKLTPTYVVQVGDLYDFHSFSKYSQSANTVLPVREVAKGKADAVAMWAAIRKASPKSQCFGLRGNHDMRITKRLEDKLPELVDVLGDDELFRFDGVQTLKTDKDILKLKFGGVPVWFSHGHRKHGTHVQYFRENCVVGHLHKAGIVYDNSFGTVKWECNVGYLGHPNAPVFNYGVTHATKNWTRGVAVISDLGHGPVPNFVSFEKR